MNEWVSVKDRLPEEYKDVLCYYEYFRYGDFNCMFRTIDRGYYGNGIQVCQARRRQKNKLRAWMQLPEPPKGYASAESNVAYWVACPYRGHEKKSFPCDGLKYPWSTLDVCGPCKEAWLNEEASE